MMKILTAVVVALVLMCGVAIADDTSNPTWTTPIAPLNPLLDQYATHTHGYDMYERGNPMGLGLDLVVYEFDGTIQSYGLDTVEIQQKYDIANTEYSLFVVCKANLWRLGNKLLGNK